MLSDGAEMPDWLIGLTVASAAPGPSWTDIVQAGAAVFAAVGVVGGLFFRGTRSARGDRSRRKESSSRRLSTPRASCSS
jgi:hypothetical protein